MKNTKSVQSLLLEIYEKYSLQAAKLKTQLNNEETNSEDNNFYLINEKYSHATSMLVAIKELTVELIAIDPESYIESMASYNEIISALQKKYNIQI